MTDEVGFAERMNSMRNYVVAGTLRDAEATWNNTTVIRGDVPAEVLELKAHPGGDLLVAGSRQLAHTLIQHGLVDEYRLMVFPIILGGGKRLFSDVSETAKLTLTDARTAGAGIQLLTYQPVPTEAPAANQPPAGRA